LLQDPSDTELSSAERPSIALTRQIGVARAAMQMHPEESLRAAGVLFEAVFGHAARMVPDTASTSDCLCEIAFALNRSINSRMLLAASWYASYLLDSIHQAHVDERRRIARDLHDQLGHGISLAMRKLDMVEGSYRNEADRSLERIHSAHQVLRDTLED